MIDDNFLQAKEKTTNAKIFYERKKKRPLLITFNERKKKNGRCWNFSQLYLYKTVDVTTFYSRKYRHSMA